MDCKISCSFGEIVDKVTILKIKQQKASDKDQLNNITKELTTIQTENPMVNKKDDLFDLLSNINQKLWNLEDSIREKSRKKEFDETYIEYAEQIHIQNDERYKVKRQINEKYNSLLKEEKVYKHLNKENNTNSSSLPTSIDMKDQKKLHIGKKLYTDGHYKESMDCIQKIMNKYRNFKEYNSFFVDLLFSYSNITSIFNHENKYIDKIFYIMDNLDSIDIPKAQKKFCISIFTTLCLERKEYLHQNSSIAYINYINGPGITPDNMSFFSKNDENKTLLIYDGGGIGDKFMLGRLVFLLVDRCVSEKNKNKITFIVQDNILWFMKELLKDYLHFIRFVSDKQLYFVGNFDYHCSLLSLIKYLKIEYNTLPKTFIPYYPKFNTLIVNDNCKKLMDSIKPNTYIINWKGNPNNPHEKHNRMMNLINALPLFKIQSSNIHWLVISKDLTQQEHKILKKHKITHIGNRIDKQQAFYDTISIVQHKNIAGVISTDTSLPHLSLSLGVKTYVLLTTGCEWRWTKDEKTNWYPDAILLRQKIHGDWKDPIQKLANLIK